MRSRRLDRVGHQLQIELSQLILSRVKDPRLGFVTVTHVDVSPDLRSACVFYSVLGDSGKRSETQRVLERASGFLQREIGSSLELRYTPKLIFRYDETLDRTSEVDIVLKEIKDEDPLESDENEEI